MEASEEEIVLGESPSFVMKRTQELRLALHRLHEDEKSAYLEAVVVAPQIVEKESDPVAFLRAESFDATKAARRLAKYWQERKSLFGDSAFFPCHVLGDGELITSDLRVLDRTYLRQTPNDSKGRPVFCLDTSRVAGEPQDTKRLRARRWMYFTTRTAMENPLSQIEGFTVLRIVDSNSDACIAGPAFECGMDFIDSSLPIRCAELHMCFVSWKESGQYTEMALPIIYQKTSELLPGRAFVHVSRTVTDMIGKLRKGGVVGAELQRWLEANWNDKNLLRRQDTGDGAAESDISSDEKGGTEENTNVMGQTQDEQLMKPKTRKERKRLFDLEYARKKRVRDRAQLDEMKLRQKELFDSKANLLREKARLEKLVADANEIVKRHVIGETKSSPSNSAVGPRQVDVVLEALGTLQQTHNCTLGELLTRPNVVEYIVGLADSTQSRSSTSAAAPVRPPALLLASTERNYADSREGLSLAKPVALSPEVGPFSPRLPLAAPTGTQARAVAERMARMPLQVLPDAPLRGRHEDSLLSGKSFVPSETLRESSFARKPAGDGDIVKSLQASLMRSLHEAEVKRKLLQSLHNGMTAPRPAVPIGPGLDLVGDTMRPLSLAANPSLLNNGALRDRLVGMPQSREVGPGTPVLGARPATNQVFSRIQNDVISKILEKLGRS